MRVLLLPHPGGERGPAGQSGHVPWPKDGVPHRRKFIRAGGTYVKDGKSTMGMLHSWIEYEAPTRVVARHEVRASELPRFTQQIEFRAGHGGGKLNTDPWVFSPGFVWAICRHRSLRRQQPASGDLVLFGSSVKGRWLLDTVFVVDYRRTCPPYPQDSEAFERLVRQPLNQRLLRPFFGKPFSSREEPFSFIPASVKGPFSRPCIDDLLPNLQRECGLSPSSKNSQALTWTTPRVSSQRFWRSLTELVEGSGLVLGLGLHHPGFAAGTHRVEAGGRGRPPACALPTRSCSEGRCAG